MQRHGLRGLLLGVSLALLLTGGVAMAAASLSIEPWCGVCCDALPVDLEAQAAVPVCDDFFTLTTSGWGDFESLGFVFSLPGPALPPNFIVPADENGQKVVHLYLMCWRGNTHIQTSAGGSVYHVVFSAHWTEEDYGKWGVLVEGSDDAVQGEFYFVEDAEACRALEFVPEPGSILLLGSGLAGLAGYAALRLRSGQALRWRTRE